MKKTGLIKKRTPELDEIKKRYSKKYRIMVIKNSLRSFAYREN